MIEITLRCRISNIFSIKYGVLGYEDPANFSDTVFHNEFLEEVNEAISKNSKNPIVKNFISSYEDSKLPFYALLEILSFGSLSKFYKNMKSEDKKAISKTYNIGYTYLESWIEHLAYVRNICAHYGRIYNYSLHKAPILYKQYSEKGINNHYIFATLICLKHLLYNDSKWLNFIETLDQLITGSPHVAVYRMGFPDDWKDILSVL
jgi:abortive infection bacteriophage resistance protein